MTQEEIATMIARRDEALREIDKTTRLLVSVGFALFFLGVCGLAIESITFDSMVQTSSEITKILNR